MTADRPVYPFRQAVILEVPSTTPFKDLTGAAVDPTTVTLRIRKPDNTIETHTGGALTHPSTGVYSYLYLPNQSGPYTYGYDGLIGAGSAADVQEFYVEQDLLS
jgi:hypothetical protein